MYVVRHSILYACLYTKTSYESYCRRMFRFEYHVSYIYLTYISIHFRKNIITVFKERFLIPFSISNTREKWK